MRRQKCTRSKRKPGRSYIAISELIKYVQQYKNIKVAKKWKSSITHHFRRFQPKWIAPLNSEYFLRIVAPANIDVRHFFENDIFWTLELLKTV